MPERFQYTITRKELQKWVDNAMVDELNQKIDGGVNQNG